MKGVYIPCGDVSLGGAQNPKTKRRRLDRSTLKNKMNTNASPVRVVLDTDTYNEVDDQFALAHLLMSPDRIKLEAVYAAPFFLPHCNSRSSSVADGMEKSYEEILRVLALVPTLQPPRVLRGSTRFISGADKAVESEAAADLVQRAKAIAGEKLYVLCIGAPTNVASALLLEPKIAENMVVVWLGGHATYWPHTREFNLQQDVSASRVLLDSNVPLVLLPCNPVTSHLITTVPELEQQLAPYSKLGAYLTDIVRSHRGSSPGRSKTIWDISASAWIIDSNWVKTEEKPSPILKDDLTWQLNADRRKILIAREVDRDAIFADFFAKAAGT
jgi:purine nucleosidase